jgi:PIN domain nuclease of toxin-antitoxin system
MGREVKYLLDTHALLWWWTDDPQLSATARACIQDEANTILISAASAWEIATKHRLGKLPLAAEAISRFNELLELDAFQHLPVSYLHALRAGGLAVDHRDPFDRMLAAQSELEGVPLITCDPAFKAFSMQTVW